MRGRALIIIVSFVLLGLLLTGSSHAHPNAREVGKTWSAQTSGPADPCDKREYSNVETRQCYTREQEKATRQVDELAREIASDFRKTDPLLGPVVAGELRKAANTVAKSQNSWAVYRKQHCDAIAFSYTTGSGAGTAHEQCMYRLARHRIAELRADFSH